MAEIRFSDPLPAITATVTAQIYQPAANLFACGA